MPKAWRGTRQTRQTFCKTAPMKRQPLQRVREVFPNRKKSHTRQESPGFSRGEEVNVLIGLEVVAGLRPIASLSPKVCCPLLLCLRGFLFGRLLLGLSFSLVVIDCRYLRAALFRRRLYLIEFAPGPSSSMGGFLAVSRVAVAIYCNWSILGSVQQTRHERNPNEHPAGHHHRDMCGRR